jgi:hypothetical protein
MGKARSAGVQIELSAPRGFFAELVADALDRAPCPPTPVATAYLIDLLAERVREPHRRGPAIDAEALLGSPGEPHAVRLGRLRGVGDAALFVAGFFGASLSRAPFGPVPTREAGRLAYAALSAALAALAALAAEPSWSWLYEELADRFGDFADLLAEVGERARGESPPRLERLYARYLVTGSARDRRFLLGLGALAPDAGGLLRPQ